MEIGRVAIKKFKKIKKPVLKILLDVMKLSSVPNSRNYMQNSCVKNTCKTYICFEWFASLFTVPNVTQCSCTSRPMSFVLKKEEIFKIIIKSSKINNLKQLFAKTHKKCCKLHPENDQISKNMFIF